ncbi:MAG: hypothetical protein MI810_09705 [Flavobacteriales bacterium]|nr:hypothetical protein [Flavobacteriales bacterium]
MERKELIIKLIQEDIKHNSLLNGLESIGLSDDERYTLNIVSIVADMMEVSNGKVIDEWLDIYHRIMLKVQPHMTTVEQELVARSLFDRLSRLT